MAAADLSEQDIDQLLSSAELSLAGKKADQPVAPKGKQQTLVPKTPLSSTSLAGKATQESHKKVAELSLRVPQIRSTGKKVRAIPHFRSVCSMRKSYPISNDAATSPRLGGRSCNIHDFFYKVIVTLSEKLDSFLCGSFLMISSLTG
jgi:hypothetical protein